MNTQLLFCIKANKQSVKLGKYFADFNFHGSPRKLDNAKSFHFTVYSGAYTSAHVLLNLLNELRKRDKM